MRTSGVLFAAVAAALVTLAAAKTQGTTLRGFTFSSDVTEYLAVSTAICDIKKVLNTRNPPYDQAQQIYFDGVDGKANVTLRKLATTIDADDPFGKTYAAHFGSDLFVDDVLQRAFSGLAPFSEPVQRVQLVVKSLESSLQVAVVMHKLDDAVRLTKEGKKAEALAALDAAWAIYVGGSPNCGLWTVSMKRANEFGTKVDCEKSEVADNILKAFLQAQAGVKAGKASEVEAARNTVKTNLAVNYIQAIITYAHEMYLDKAANISAAENQVEAYAFFRTIAPWVYAANSTAGKALDFYLFPGNPVTDDVDLKSARALSTTYKALGVTPEAVGTYGKKQPQLGCPAYVPSPSEQGGLLSTTNAKDSLRPTEGAGAAAAAAAPKAAAEKPAAAAAAKAAEKPGGRRRFV